MTAVLDLPEIHQDQKLLQEMVREVKPRPKHDPGTWAEQNRVLTSKESTVPGKFSMSITPHLREIARSLFNPRVKEVVAKKPVQAAISTLAFNWVGQRIDEDPCAMMYVLPGEKTSKKNLSQKIEPLLATPTIKDRTSIRDDSGKKNKSNALEITFPNGILLLGNSNSSTDLRNVYTELRIGDEIEEWPDDLKGQGSALELFDSRAATALTKQTFLFSTPLSEETSKIKPAYERSDMRIYEVPCPHCQHKQELLFENLYWAPGQPKTAHFICVENGCIIEEKDKYSMVSKGEWRATKTEVKDIHGYHWNCFIQILGITWAEFAEKWEASEGHPSRKTIINNYLGLTTQDAALKRNWKTLYDRREHFPIRRIPKEAVIVTAGADVQQSPARIEAYVWAWGPNGERWFIDFQVFSGRVDIWDGEAFQQLSAFMETSYPHELGGAAKIKMLAIDRRKHSDAVLAWASQDPMRRMAVHGVGEKDLKPLPVLGFPQRKEVDVEGLPKTIVQSYPVGSGTCKMELFTQLALEMPGSGKTPYGWVHLPVSEEICNQENLEQLVGEVLIERVDKLNRPTRQWKKTRKRNEALDCTNYARAAASRLALDAYSHEDWQEELREITSRNTLRVAKKSEQEEAADNHWGDSPENHW